MADALKALRFSSKMSNIFWASKSNDNLQIIYQQTLNIIPEYNSHIWAGVNKFLLEKLVTKLKNERLNSFMKIS